MDEHTRPSSRASLVAARADRLLSGTQRPRSQPPRRFVVLGMQRTGSNLVVTTLSTHPAIFCHGELFRRSDEPIAQLRTLATFDPRFHDQSYRIDHPGEYLEAVYGIGYDVEFVGFKLLAQQHPSMRNRLIDDPRYAKILLRRDNVLACYSSQKVTPRIHQGEAAKGEKTVFVADEFGEFHRSYDQFYADTRERLQTAGQPFLEISYIDACTPDGLHRVVRAVGADPSVELRVGTKKRNSSDMLSRFSNPGEVEAYLARNGLEHWRMEPVPRTGRRISAVPSHPAVDGKR